MANITNSKPTVIGLPKISFTPEATDFAFVDIKKLKRTDQIVGKPTKYGREIFKRFLQNRWGIFFSFILLLVLLTAIFVAILSGAGVIRGPNDTLPGSSTAIANLPPRPFVSIEPNGPKVLQYGTNLELTEARNNGILVTGSEQLDTNGWTYHWYTTPYTYRDSETNQQPLMNQETIIGTDNLGRDLWVRLWIGTGTSLGMALAVALVSTAIGIIYGAISGSYAGRATDTIMMRIIDVISGVPSVIWLFILGVMIKSLQTPVGETLQANTLDNSSIIATLICISWMRPAATTRIYILKNKDADYIQATRTLGGRQLRVIFTHMLPVIMGRLAVMFVNMIPSFITTEASLQFLSLADPTNPGLGTMLNQTWQTTNTSEIYAPIVVFAALTISAQIVANALNDAIDPRVVGRG